MGLVIGRNVLLVIYKKRGGGFIYQKIVSTEWKRISEFITQRYATNPEWTSKVS